MNATLLVLAALTSPSAMPEPVYNTLGTPSIVSILAGQSNTAPKTPAGGSNLGSGTNLLDTSAANSKVVADATLPGGHRSTLRWLYWKVYTRPTGNKSILATQVCNNSCTSPGGHLHPAGCSIGGCAKKCEFGHKVSLQSTRETTDTKSITTAVQRAISVGVSVGTSLGYEAGPIKAGLEITSSVSSTTSQSLEQAVSSAFSKSSSGSVEINLEHFNPDPCSKSTWVFGTYEYEVRVIFQMLEQDYYCESWIIGGRGVLPSGRLRATGNARFLGQPQDVQIALYDIPSNEPLDKKHEVICGCRPVTTTSPRRTSTTTGGSGTDTGGAGTGGGTGSGAGTTGTSGDTTPPSHSMLPSGTSRITVTPKPDEQLTVFNPYNEAITFTAGTVQTRIEPKGSTKVATPDEPTDCLIQTLTGLPILALAIDAGSSLFRRDSGKPAPIPNENVTIGPKTVPFGDNSLEWLGIPDPGFENIIPSPSTDPLKEVSIGGIPVDEVPVIGAGTPFMEFKGDLPNGCQIELQGSNMTAKGAVLAEVGSADGASTVIGQIPGAGAVVDPKLVIRDPQGNVISSQQMAMAQPSIAISTEPETGEPGTPATLVVNCQEVMAYLEMSGANPRGNIVLSLDFSQSGGATGPAKFDLPPSGIARIPVRRGTSPGSFQVGVGMNYKAVSMHSMR
ncbi:hypothetical protein QPK87_09700 [Kamptonema cortianum]|nr:hypothetical protein [Geitlerinema splendidum]MDK3156848.1 hypothetical protein [Kamptonema cortianum]